ncbi:hypothetical protein O0L34_g19150 [Tuta absoluta]|nr:hypothetical protein O0L34_g19150 [Tuta absoluta]
MHFFSDSPSAQYRNRKMFYVIAKLHLYYISLRHVVWNYSEAGHGKGAPDGVGGVLKRTADQIVARGNDIQNMESFLIHLRKNVSNVILKVVEASAIFEKDLLIPAKLKEFRGSMSVHQVVWSSKNADTLAMRRLSCGLDDFSLDAVECPHGQHIGFFNLKEFNTKNVNQGRTKPKPKRVAKTKNTSLVKRSRKNVNEDSRLDSRNALESFNLTVSDSFWTEVPSIDERIFTSTLTEAVIESLHDRIDLPSSAERILAPTLTENEIESLHEKIDVPLSAERNLASTPADTVVASFHERSDARPTDKEILIPAKTGPVTESLHEPASEIESTIDVTQIVVNDLNIFD